ncbi:hypothetical protein pb186bvf_010195 [Paramecium bursaria]
MNIQNIQNLNLYAEENLKHQELALYESKRQRIDKQLQQQGMQEVYLVDKCWMRQWRYYSNFYEDQEDNEARQKPPMMNQQIVISNKEIMSYKNKQSTLNVSVIPIRDQTEYEIGQLDDETYKFFSKRYGTAGDIVRIAVYDPTIKQKIVRPNLAQIAIFYKSKEQTDYKFIQVDLNAKISHWIDQLRQTFDVNLRIWRHRVPNAKFDYVLSEIRKNKFQGFILQENQFVFETLSNGGCVLLDFLQQDQKWQFEQDDIAHMQSIIYDRIIHGCGNVMCKFEFCKDNIDFGKNHFSEEEAQGIAETLVLDETFEFNICFQDHYKIKPINSEEFLTLPPGSATKKLIELSKNIDSFGLSFLKDNIEYLNNEPLINQDAIQKLGKLITDKEFYRNIVDNLFTEKSQFKIQRVPIVIQNIYQLRVAFIMLNFQFFYMQLSDNKLLQSLSTMREDLKQTLAIWFSTMDQQLFIRIQNELRQAIHDVIEAQSKLPLPIIEIEKIRQLQDLFQLYKVIYRANQKVVRLPRKQFIVENIPKFYTFAPEKQEYIQFKYLKIDYVRLYYFTFCLFPFAIPLEFKNKILSIESRMKQSNSIREAIYTFSLDQMYLKIDVNRHDIMGALEQLVNLDSRQLKRPLRVTFIGEQAVDEGGVRRELFSLLMQDLFNLNYGMFVSKMNDTILWFNIKGFEMAIQYEYIGILLGLALYNQILLDLRFPPVIYKKLMGEELVEDDLKDLDIDQYSAFIKLREYKADDLQDVFLLTFNATYDVFGERHNDELMPNGDNTLVTQDNKELYIKLYLDWYLNKSVEKQFGLFQKGFQKVVNGEAIKLFNGEELQTLIVGSPHFDMFELEQVTKYDGYDKQDNYIKQFWKLIHTLDIIQQKKFLFFCTGTDRVPVGGLKSMKFMIQKHGENTEQLPSAHTCFNVLLLPHYKSENQLRIKLLKSLENSEGFGLM